MPTVLRQRAQRTTPGEAPAHTGTNTSPGLASPPAGDTAGGKHLTPNRIAPAPQLAAVQAQAATAVVASSAASAEALGFYRIPLFLLPIYRAAAARYGVPWQILAAINEVETNYGADLSISTAGAEGWMQFMPATWRSYGVDALNAGYADPYNPVDAIFAAARYLRAAGAATDLRAAVFAYNHSAEYVASVLLRAKLISSYPRDVIAALTALASARLPLTGGHVAWEQARARPPKRSRSPQSVVLTSAPDALAVAVQDGRIVKLGRSRALGRFVVLQDVYGDEFTYSGLGSLGERRPRSSGARARHPALDARRSTVFAGWPGGGNVLFSAHARNPEVLALAAGSPGPTRRHAAQQLHPGALVAAGTALGSVNVPAGARRGHIRFAIRPAGDPGMIAPQPVLASWGRLDLVLHPQSARAREPLLGATASDALMRTRAELEQAALSDPGVALDACARHPIVSRSVDRRVLATIAYLSRSGLHPTVRLPGCRRGEPASGSSARILRVIDLVAINGVPIARRQRAVTIADRTIRTLLTIPTMCAPHAIWSHARYPGAPSTHAAATYRSRIRVSFSQRSSCNPSTPSAVTVVPDSARIVRWERLIRRIAALQLPPVVTEPSAAAIRPARGR